MAGDLKSPCPSGLIQAISGHSEPAQHPRPPPAVPARSAGARLWAPRMSRFRGYRSIWSMCLSFALKGPRISTFRRRNPLELETQNLDWVFDGPDGVPSERTRNPRADRAPGRRFSFRANQQKPSSDLRPPLSGRSIPLLFFKARARQQKLEPPAIGPWRRPHSI